MLRITIEFVPHGDESRAEVLATASIANDGTGTPTRGNYRVWLSKRKSLDVWKRGTVEGFPRQRLGPWDLLCWALLACGIGERMRESEARY